MTDDRWITLYNKDKNPTLLVRLTEEGHKRYKEGEKWDSSWVDPASIRSLSASIYVGMSCRRILRG